MVFTKEELKQELREFMVGWARSAERLFGGGRSGGLLGFPERTAWHVEPAEAMLDDAHLWRSVLTMYDYGIEGRRHPSFGADGDVANQYGEAEMFLLGLNSLALFLEEDEVRWPKLAQRTVRTAMARHILDGGERYITREEDEVGGYLSFGEIALLADMDERSVRNAANPRLPDALVTKSIGRRSMIALEDARRWLAGRKAFVPTQGAAPGVALAAAPQEAYLTVPGEIATRLSEAARSANLSPADFLAQLLDRQVQDKHQAAQ